MTTKTERNSVIDIAKGIAIYLVVLGHLQLIPRSETAVLIASCHMPLFFFVSGLFFEKSISKISFSKFLIKKTRTLLVPYFAWSTVAFLVNVVLLNVSGNRNSILNEAFQIFINARSLWFLLALFLTCVVTGVVWKIVKNKIVFVGVTILIWLILLLFGRIQLLSLYKVAWLYPYYLLGIIAMDSDNFLTWLNGKDKKWTSKRIFTDILVCMLFLISNLWLVNDSLFSEFYENFSLEVKHCLFYILFYCVGILGIYLILEIAFILDWLKSIGLFVREMGIYSLDIYVIHMFFVKAIFIIMSQIQSDSIMKTQGLLAFYSLVIVLTILICVKTLRKIKIYNMMMGEK